MIHQTKLCWGLALAVVLSIAGCKKEAAPAVRQPSQVSVAQPVVRELTNFLEFTGTIKAVESVEVRARVEGFLETVHFEDGADVEAGDLLFTIDPRPFQASLAESQAALKLAEATVVSAKANLRKSIAEANNQKVQYERAAQAAKSGAITATEIDNLKTLWDAALANAEISKAMITSAEAEVAARQAALQQAKINLSYTKIHSPISGRMGQTLVDPGNLVGGAQQTLLAQVVLLDPIHAIFDIDERAYLKFLDKHGGSRDKQHKKEAPVFLARQGDQEYEFAGTIDFLDNVLDPSTGTILARGIFSNPELRLTPGMFVRLRIPQEVRPDTLLVEEHAISTDMTGKTLLTVDRDSGNIVQLRRVELGQADGMMRVVLSGIGPEDEYIVEGNQRARPGLKVHVQRATESAASEASAPQ